MGFFDALKAGMEKTRKNLTENIERLVVGYAQIDDELLEELEAILLTADVGVKTTETLLSDIKAAIKKKEIETPQDLKPYLRKRMTEILALNAAAISQGGHKPLVLLVVGVNGVGKTTTIGKLGRYFRQQGKSVMLAAGDTFRAAAIDQLEIWGKRIDADVMKHTEGADPAAVAYDACKSAVARGVDVLIIDTAGRLHTKTNLMEELKKVHRVIAKEIVGAPHETLLVLDATTGQNAMSQANIFSQAAQVSGIVLTKLDGSAKGGVVLAIKHELDIPVRWIGVGEGMDDLRPFIPEEFVAALFADKE
ncbi:signal recognition particle-docking protein FtsY [Acetonema longum]|uniref:Signal recognition particle receptor FtsY n=1 Tax=Acetonema longum DSM 6540 TaxID=1009370 RepID=F7NFN7_9FIRM|nr:signal recognition particle-docking protein FtsY [Acetonema longum]EGO65160.1 signal recognition particle-docking protein FtsY [Acetonema longum DSM 6540]